MDALYPQRGRIRKRRLESGALVRSILQVLELIADLLEHLAGSVDDQVTILSASVGLECLEVGRKECLDAAEYEQQLQIRIVRP